jgi:hypothetical protein
VPAKKVVGISGALSSPKVQGPPSMWSMKRARPATMDSGSPPPAILL